MLQIKYFNIHVPTRNKLNNLEGHCKMLITISPSDHMYDKCVLSLKFILMSTLLYIKACATLGQLGKQVLFGTRLKQFHVMPDNGVKGSDSMNHFGAILMQ